MFDVPEFAADRDHILADLSFANATHIRKRWSKQLFDIVGAGLLFVPLLTIGVVLLVLNPFFNAGPVLYAQTRMGLGCRPFKAFKFRTMAPARKDATARGAFDALETERISLLGHFLRRTRVDELPQIINVLRGEMSLIGPRPDSFDHARVYLDAVPDYRARHRILPGISGYAQTEVGYVDGLDGVRRKVAADLYYLAHASLRLDLWITWRTLCVVLGRKGC